MCSSDLLFPHGGQDFFADVGGVGETLHAFFQANEDAKGRELGHGSLDDHFGGKAVFQGRPGIGLAAPDAKGDFLFDAVEGEDINVYLGAGLENFAGRRKI